MPEMSSIKVPKLSFPTDSFLTRDRGRVSRVTAARKDGGSGLFGPHTMQNKVHGLDRVTLPLIQVLWHSSEMVAKSIREKAREIGHLCKCRRILSI